MLILMAVLINVRSVKIIEFTCNLSKELYVNSF
jgi:hypothetical protein